MVEHVLILMMMLNVLVDMVLVVKFVKLQKMLVKINHAYMVDAKIMAHITFVIVIEDGLVKIVIF